MENLYEQLGFKQPKILENSCGIRIHIGTKGKDDWGVEIPKELCKAKSPRYNFNHSYMMYLVTEKEALSVAKEYTELAKRLKR